MDLVTFLVYIAIVAIVYLFALLVYRSSLFRALFVLIAFLPIGLMLAFFIFRIPQLKNETHRTQFFENWKVGGHRGSSHDGIPENSLEAFLAVKNEGGQLAEMDIQITSDGVAVICHDSNVERLTGVNKDISSMTLAQFKQLTYSGTNITMPTFAEAVQFCVQNNIMMIWDVKNLDEALITQFVIQIRTYNLYSKVLVSGFNPIDTYFIKLADQKILTGFTWRMWELSTTDEDATINRFTGILHGIATVADVVVYSLTQSLIVPKFLGSDMIFYHVNDHSRYLEKAASDNNIYLAGWTSKNEYEMNWLKNYIKVPFLTDNVSLAP
ncbi:unnamed protein product [Caenorhabditis angaria]|uniref:GP-PDE domain-containing protein n=1 Tax=Caenorhabditis angaria TaxID=860376 RepID=A0A9P1IK37_9PELO|nr:unnamed protein product [Caenorhabditis angaria]